MSEPYDFWAEFWKIYVAGIWEPQTRALLERILRPGDLFVDVGGWIGPVSLWALDLGARVVAIEPDPVAAAEYRRNVPDAELWEGALSTSRGRSFIAPREGAGLGDSMARLADHGTPVETWTLQEVLGDRVPALVKIDVEGHEVELCPQVGPLLARLGVPLQVSFHGEFVPRECFAGYAAVSWPEEPWGDLVALP